MCRVTGKSPWFLELHEKFCWIFLRRILRVFYKFYRKKICTNLVEIFQSVACIQGLSYWFFWFKTFFLYIQSIGSNHMKIWGVLTVFCTVLQPDTGCISFHKNDFCPWSGGLIWLTKTYWHTWKNKFCISIL